MVYHRVHLLEDILIVRICTVRIIKIFIMLYNAVFEMLCCPKFYLVLKNHNPSIYKQPFYTCLLTLTYFLFEIAILSVCSQLSSIPNLQQCAEHHHIPLQSAHSSSIATSVSFLVPLLCSP